MKESIIFEINQLFKLQVDKDGDGEICYEEFVQMIAPIVNETNKGQKGTGAFE
jgi:Ca2+-binding EF-hand superfamily protein